MNLVLLVIILGVFLVQRQKFTRATETGISTWKALREVRQVPSELRRLREVRWAFGGGKALLVAAVLVFPLFASPSQEQLAGLIFIYAIIAVSLVVLTGWAGNISLGQFALVGFGAATTGTLVARHNWDLFLAIPVAMAVSAAVAFLIGLPALRITGPFLAVTTLAFAVVSSHVFLEDRYFPWFVPDFVPRPVLWQRIHWDQDWQMYLVAFVGLVLSMAAARSLRNSRTGRAILATRDNLQAAQSVSVPTTRVKLTAFAVSGAIAGFAGALYVMHQTAFKTDSFGPEVSLRLFTMVVIGGLGSLPGAVLGAVYVRGVEFFLRGGYAQIASGGGLMLLLLVLPGGLGELMYRIRDYFLRWVARRHSLVVPSLVADVRLETEEAPIALGAALGGLTQRKFGAGRRPVANGRTNGHGKSAATDTDTDTERAELEEATTS
jgi:branched-chain amino acid transport system permease protein